MSAYAAAGGAEGSVREAAAEQSVERRHPGGRIALDSDDVWLRAIAGEGGLLQGGGTLDRAFPMLAQGRAHFRARDGEPGPVRGVVGRLPGLSSLLPPERAASATQLERLGKCPLRFLHREVLGARPADDPEFDRVRWLDHAWRGKVLHSVYHGALQEAGRTGIPPAEDRFEELCLARLDLALAEAEERVPAPGQGAIHRERRALRGDVRSFVRHIREDAPRWLRTEHPFGGRRGGRDAVLSIGGLQLTLRGRIDRVDEVEGGLRVIDYKTGSVPQSSWAGGADPAFRGGRQLQHALYARAAEASLGLRVAEAGYLYPTLRGQNELVIHGREELDAIEAFLPDLIGSIGEGSFVPTDDAADCRFCDYRSSCRVGSSGPSSSPAEWSKEWSNMGHPAFEGLRAARERRPEGGGAR